MSVSSNLEYLNQNNLHFAPISARVFSGVRFVATAIHQCGSTTSWHGHIFRGLSKGIVVLGFTINTPIALVEVIATLSIGLLASIVHVLTKARYPMLQKYTIKCLAYCINSAAVGFAQIYGVITLRFPTSHTWNAIGTHLIYLGSAAFIHLLFGSCFDHIAGRNPEDRNAQVPAIDRILTFSWEHAQESVLHDVMSGMERDFGVSQVLRNFANIPSLQRFYQAYPQHQSLLREFQVSRLTDENYRENLLAALIDIGMHYHLLERTPGNQLEVIVNVHDERIKNYQKHMQECIKRAYKDIHSNVEFCHFLGDDPPEIGKKALLPSEKVAQGRERLGYCDHSAVLPLVYLAQLNELGGDDVCPVRFTDPSRPNENHELRVYDSRADSITAARKLLKGFYTTAGKKLLDPKVKEERARLKRILISKLMYGSSYDKEIGKRIETVRKDFGLTTDQDAKIKPLIKTVTELAGQLHQGKLMSQLTVNIRNGEFSGNNLFTKAVQEVYAEISAQEAAKKKQQNEANPVPVPVQSRT